MLFRQIIHEDLGCASYLVGDSGAGVAAVVDPQWDIDPYLNLARLHGVRIEHVLETHNHADHVSGHGRLARATGATIHVSALAEAEYEHDPIADGWTLALGEGVTIEAVHTPGHRPEHTSFLLRDAERGGDPVAVLSGDSLFVGDVARPDLAVEPREGAAGIFRSLHERLLSLPDEVEVWPGHLGGSLCGSSGIDLKTSSTIGFERRHNRALAIADEAEFIEDAVASIGDRADRHRGEELPPARSERSCERGAHGHPAREVDAQDRDGRMGAGGQMVEHVRLAGSGPTFDPDDLGSAAGRARAASTSASSRSRPIGRAVVGTGSGVPQWSAPATSRRP